MLCFMIMAAGKLQGEVKMSKPKRKNQSLFNESERNLMRVSLKTFCENYNTDTLGRMDTMINLPDNKFRLYSEIIEAALLDCKNEDHPFGITNFDQLKAHIAKEGRNKGWFYNNQVTKFLDKKEK